MIIQYIVIALIPVLLLLTFLRVTDRFDKEPANLLMKLFTFGFLSALPIMLVENIIQSLNIFQGGIALAFDAFIVAGFTEEIFKRGIVLKVAYHHQAFDEKLDGIIYCAFAGLGFAAIENILYIIFQSAANPNIAITRGLLSVPAHMLFAVTMGYYLSMAKFAKSKKKREQYMKRSLIEPIILHGLFNFILMTNMHFLFIFIPYVLFLWLINMKKLRRFYQLSKSNHKIEQQKTSHK